MTGELILATAVLVVVAGYAGACAWWPFKACRRCAGAGRLRSPSGRAFRLCRRCKATGRRVRTGRRIFNWIRVLRSDT